MKNFSEGRKMFFSVMVIFIIYAAIFIMFEDYDRRFFQPFNEVSDWHLLLFSLVVMAGLSVLLHRYAHRMDERISREQAAKENQMRRELTQNISHELKTPVASILGYTDTILENPDMTDETRRQFIVRTNAQARRLTSLLQDLSTLNRMDYAVDMLSMERVDVSQMIADIKEETALALAQKKMTLRNCLPQHIVINGNFSLIYSIFRNLVDNSLCYAGEGKTIEVAADDRDDCWHFTFFDNGQGIDEQHLPRIFERFYRIDKSRSRAQGGTGLGLAIVKNAVMLHGGNITASNRPEGGILFEFTLKKKV
jgi:two-component system OmpR family sensor kinase/two-component system phosphate regulon sensor histidine kinase PhoR